MHIVWIFIANACFYFWNIHTGWTNMCPCFSACSTFCTLISVFPPWLVNQKLPEMYRQRSLRSVSSAECFVATHEGKDCHSETLLLQKCLLSSKKQNEVLNTRINYNTQYLHTYICCCPTYWTVWNSIASPMIAQIWSKTVVRAHNKHKRSRDGKELTTRLHVDAETNESTTSTLAHMSVAASLDHLHCTDYQHVSEFMQWCVGKCKCWAQGLRA